MAIANACVLLCWVRNRTRKDLPAALEDVITEDWESPDETECVDVDFIKLHIM